MKSQRKRSWASSRSRAFFSIDAGFALVIAVMAFFSFSLVEASAYSFSASSAKEIEGTNIALRLSSYVLNDAGAEQGGIDNSYVRPGELDPDRISNLDLNKLRTQSRLSYASITLSEPFAALAPPASGAPNGEVYCVKRLALVSNEPALMEVCIS